MNANPLHSASSQVKRQFLNRFLQTEVKPDAVNIPAEPSDQIELSEVSGSRSKGLALQTAAKIEQLATTALGPALPVVVSAAILRSVWPDQTTPVVPQPEPSTDPKVLKQLPQGFVQQEAARHQSVLQKLNQDGEPHSAAFVVNQVDSPASAYGEEVLVNLLAAAQAFRSEELLAFALAHEKGHITQGDTTWEPTATGMLWEVMTEGYAEAENQGDEKAAQQLDRGIQILEKSFHANAQANEVEADAEAVRTLAKAGYDRKPGLAFLLRTAGDAHHPPGPQRVASLQHYLQGTEHAISQEELKEIYGLANSLGQA